MKKLCLILALAAILSGCAKATKQEPVSYAKEYRSGYEVLFYTEDGNAVCLLVDGVPTMVELIPEYDAAWEAWERGEIQYGMGAVG